jgi:hypothetical protein
VKSKPLFDAQMKMPVPKRRKKTRIRLVDFNNPFLKRKKLEDSCILAISNQRKALNSEIGALNQVVSHDLGF